MGSSPTATTITFKIKVMSSSLIESTIRDNLISYIRLETANKVNLGSNPPPIIYIIGMKLL